MLIVEDNDDIRECVCFILEEQGFATLIAANGRQALNVLHRQKDALPCLVLLDLNMPVMNGWEFYARFARDPLLVAIPVIVMTASPLATSADWPRLLRKPLQAEQLLSAVREAC